MKFLAYLFTPNEKHEGVRPINIYLLRVLNFLMIVGVATDAWGGLLRHEGPWEPNRAVAVAVWAAYPTLAVFGLIRPLQWLPIVVFMISYKTIWLVAAAYPLWKAGTLAGSPSEEMASVFLAAPLISLIVPWKYFFQNFVWPRRYSPK